MSNFLTEEQVKKEKNGIVLTEQDMEMIYGDPKAENLPDNITDAVVSVMEYQATPEILSLRQECLDKYNKQLDLIGDRLDEQETKNLQNGLMKPYADAIKAKFHDFSEVYSEILLDMLISCNYPIEIMFKYVDMMDKLKRKEIDVDEGIGNLRTDLAKAYNVPIKDDLNQESLKFEETVPQPQSKPMYKRKKRRGGRRR